MQPAQDQKQRSCRCVNAFAAQRQRSNRHGKSSQHPPVDCFAPTVSAASRRCRLRLPHSVSAWLRGRASLKAAIQILGPGQRLTDQLFPGQQRGIIKYQKRTGPFIEFRRHDPSDGRNMGPDGGHNLVSVQRGMAQPDTSVNKTCHIAQKMQHHSSQLARRRLPGGRPYFTAAPGTAAWAASYTGAADTAPRKRRNTASFSISI